MSIVVRQSQFNAGKYLYDTSALGLGAMIRGLAIDNARLAIKTKNPQNLTDSSTGVAAAGLVDIPVPQTPFNAAGGNGEQLTDLLTALGNLNVAHDTLGAALNGVLYPLGMPNVAGIASNTGDIAATGTILFNVQPNAGDTVTVNGTALTFEPLPAEGSLPAGQIGIDPSGIDATVQNLVTYVDQTAALGVTARTTDNGAEVVFAAAAAGTAGNAITLASSNGAQTVSGADLSGGATDGTIAHTIPAQAKAGTAATGAAAADFTTSVSALKIVKLNQQRLARVMASALVALGEPALVSALAGAYPADFNMHAVNAPVASVGGASALAVADATAFYAAAVNNIATMAAVWNAALADVQAGTGQLHVVAG